MRTIPATDAREQVIANSQFGSGTPATWYLALSKTTPNEDGSNFTEPTGGSYARVLVTNNTTNFPAAITTSGTTTKANGVAFTFANPTGNWGLITHYGWFTTLTGGTPEYWNPVDAPITVQSGNTPVEFGAGNLVMSWGD